MAKLEQSLVASSSDDAQRFLLGGNLSFADVQVSNTAIQFELAYRWRFNIGGDSIADALWSLVERILAIQVPRNAPAPAQHEGSAQNLCVSCMRAVLAFLSVFGVGWTCTTYRGVRCQQ
mmetsp:Transcript_23299/g.47519  ORF Transcript_23299/g.47519 Transcript_23299/m.47519 type:complete len:119 (+) Transcript_23299:115-471(+)